MMQTSTRALPRKLSELGRIRIGDRQANSSGRGTHPNKLQTFRLTSPNKPLLHCAASLYGGEVQPWAGEGAPVDHYELYTTANALDVLVPTLSAVSISYEQWRQGGCTLRCTGERISHSPLDESRIGQLCACPTDDHERESAARQGTACARILRLNVLLPDLPGLGCWRLETKGYYATAECLGALEMLQMAEHQIIEAVLRLEWRGVKRYQDGKSSTLQFAVPVLWPKYTPRQMLAAADKRVLLMAPPAPLPAPDIQGVIADVYGERDQESAGKALSPEPSVLIPQPSVLIPQPSVLIPQPSALVPPSSAPPPLVLEPDAPQAPAHYAGETFVAQIDAAWRAAGIDDGRIASYWTKTCTRFKVASREQIKASVLPALLGEVRAWIAKQGRRTEPSALSPQPWRSQLVEASQAVQDGALLQSIWDALDDPETPDTVGLALIEQVQGPEAGAQPASGEVG